MGGAVSSGRDNNELIDNLMGGNYIRTRSVERVFRALDRADYMTPESRDQAYKDLAWRNGLLHMSAPCIYSKVVEGLELKPGLSFLNIGSGTGYLSTLVGLLLGSGGINHGVEVHPTVVEYATKKLSQFLENSPTLDEFDFCEPKFYCGNGLCLAPLQAPYDRVYCGAGCPEEYQNYFQQLIKIGGVLVMPLNDTLVQVRRVSATEWRPRMLLNVSFATLRAPDREQPTEPLRLEEQSPPRLQVLCRGAVRGAMRASLLSRHPELRAPPPRPPPARRAHPRRICIPLDDDSDVENLNALHDLDAASGANEMNALLSLVLSMGHNRVAGALRFDPHHSSRSTSRSTSNSSSSTSSSSSQSSPPQAQRVQSSTDTSDDDDDASDDPKGSGAVAIADRPPPESQSGDASLGLDVGGVGSGSERAPLARPVIMFEFRENSGGGAVAAAAAPGGAGAGGHADTTRRPGGNRSKSSKSKTDSGFELHTEDDNVPNEVEIYLADGGAEFEPEAEAEAEAEAGPSHMEWEKGTEAKREHSSDEETTESTSKAKEEKRQKFDSGVGEENTPSSGSSPAKSAASDSDGRSHSPSATDEGCDDGTRSRRRLQKRPRGQAEPHSSSSTEAEDDECSRRHRRRTGAPAEGPDARRVRLSIMMKRGVKELPLPYALKKYVNLGRCFEF